MRIIQFAFLFQNSTSPLPPCPIVAHLTLRIIISTNSNLHYPRMLSHKFQHFLSIWFLKNRFFSIYSFVKKIDPSLWPQHYPKDHDLNKLEFTLITFISHSLSCQLGFEKKFWRKKIHYMFLCKNWTIYLWRSRLIKLNFHYLVTRYTQAARILKILLFIFLFKNSTPTIWVPPYPDWNKCKSTLPNDVSPQVISCLADWFLK